jgi:hypothetical protein
MGPPRSLRRAASLRHSHPLAGGTRPPQGSNAFRDRAHEGRKGGLCLPRTCRPPAGSLSETMRAGRSGRQPVARRRARQIVKSAGLQSPSRILRTDFFRRANLGPTAITGVCRTPARPS